MRVRFHRPYDRSDYRADEHERDDAERERGVDVHAERHDQHLHADEGENYGESHFQVVEFLDDPGEQEVERAQAEYGKDVRGVDDEGIARHGEDRRDGIDRKDEVGGLDYDEDHQQQGAVKPPVDAGEEMGLFVMARDRHEPPDDAQHGVFFGINLRLLLEEHLDAGVDEKGAEDVNDPAEVIYQGRAQKYHDGAHDERPEHAPEEDAVLVLRGHFEVRKDQ